MPGLRTRGARRAHTGELRQSRMLVRIRPANVIRFAHNDVTRFARNDAIPDGRNDVMFAHCAKGTTSLPKATSLGEADITCP